MGIGLFLMGAIVVAGVAAVAAALNTSRSRRKRRSQDNAPNASDIPFLIGGDLSASDDHSHDAGDGGWFDGFGDFDINID